jgi:hypothetical protein
MESRPIFIVKWCSFIGCRTTSRSAAPIADLTSEGDQETNGMRLNVVAVMRAVREEKWGVPERRVVSHGRLDCRREHSACIQACSANVIFEGIWGEDF